jgi:hypothetical protein
MDQPLRASLSERTSWKNDKAKFAFLGFSEVQPPNILLHHDRGCAAPCALSSSVKGLSLGPGLSGHCQDNIEVQ